MRSKTRHLLLLLLVILLPMQVTRAETKGSSALDKAIELLSAKRGLQVSFRMTLEEETTDCRYYAEGRRFHYDSAPIKAWYDGIDLWVYIDQSGEVNLSTPQKEDLVEINPLLNLEGIRERGFDVRETTEGKNVRVTAIPGKKYRGELKRLTALITPDGYPLSLTIEEKGLKTPIEIIVTLCEEGPFPQLRDKNFFTHTPAKTPGATLIDLR